MPDDPVAHRVAVRIVDDLEVIDVEHDQREGRLAPGGPAQLSLEVLLEEAVIVEPGEPVGERLLLAGDQPLEHDQAVDRLRRQHRQQV